MLRLVAIAAGLLLLSILAVVAVGYALPQGHVAARAIQLRQQPAVVFALISNFKEAPAWRPDIRQVELLPDGDGHARFREKSRNNAITYEVIELNPPQRMITRIDDRSLPFGGEWIFEIFPTSAGCRLNITERGEVYNPVFRFVSRFVLGYNGTLDSYLKDVARKFNEGSMPVAGNPAPQ